MSLSLYTSRSITRACALLFGLLIVFSAHGVAKPSPLHFAIGEWPPYTTSETPNGGLLEPIITSIFEPAGYQVHFHYFPWVRSLKLVTRGKYHATFPWYISEIQADSLLISSSPLNQTKTVFFHHKQVPFRWRSFADLMAFRIGSVDGYTVTRLLTRHQVPTLPSMEQSENFQKLYHGRVDAIAAEERVGEYWVNHVSAHQHHHILIDPNPVLMEPMHVLFHHDALGEELNAVFEAGLQRLKASGCYTALLNQRSCQAPTP
ncbi:substrate-binding periplasmic protein [Vibrio coralliilyticus]|uniref:substrate-binding periplasmic protein n=1 Tax=Vibrio coralliilyticus TaxID=190893 RepID=UPI0020B83880|nr:transporter substrate-binding domain-containing protein [Vibrio coralliilyticus]